METIIEKTSIDQAIGELAYRNQQSLKYRLLDAIQNRYTDVVAAPMKEIPTDELVALLWNTNNDRRVTANRRKNFFSIKSAVNKDLKKLYKQGKNPEGLIIGPQNFFVMSDEAKEDLLETLTKNANENSISDLNQLARIMGLLSQMLGGLEIIKAAKNADLTKQMENLMRVLSEQVGAGSGKKEIKEPGLSEETGQGLENAGTAEGAKDEGFEAEILEEPDSEEFEEDEDVLEDAEDEEIADEDISDEVDGQDIEDEDVLEYSDEIEDDEIIDEVADEDDEDTETSDEFKDDGLNDGFEEGEGGGTDLELSMGTLGAEISSNKPQPDKKRVLAEQFDGYLGSMERFYNQYLLIPGGIYIVGAKSPLNGDRPEQKIQIEPFFIGKFPVTTALFEIFVEKTGYVTTAEEKGYGMVYTGLYRKTSDPHTSRAVITMAHAKTCEKIKGACWFQPQGPGSTLHMKRNHPVVQVSRRDALAFAAWTGKILPTENQWEAAARTRDGLFYPWGNKWENELTNTEESRFGETCAVDYFENANTLDISDTLGNILEWTADIFSPKNASQDIFIVKSSSWISNKNKPLFSRKGCKDTETSNILGFRCVAV